MSASRAAVAEGKRVMYCTVQYVLVCRFLRTKTDSCLHSTKGEENMAQIHTELFKPGGYEFQFSSRNQQTFIYLGRRAPTDLKLAL